MNHEIIKKVRIEHVSFKWNGDQLAAKVRQAEKEALLETNKAIVNQVNQQLHMGGANQNITCEIIKSPSETNTGLSSQVGFAGGFEN
jgi:hypothetical protein